MKWTSSSVAYVSDDFTGRGQWAIESFKFATYSGNARDVTRLLFGYALWVTERRRLGVRGPFDWLKNTENESIMVKSCRAIEIKTLIVQYFDTAIYTVSDLMDKTRSTASFGLHLRWSLDVNTSWRTSTGAHSANEMKLNVQSLVQICSN